jgi:hypothetical protein
LACVMELNLCCNGIRLQKHIAVGVTMTVNYDLVKSRVGS